MSILELDSIIEERITAVQITLRNIAKLEDSPTYSESVNMQRKVRGKLKLVTEEIDSILAEYNESLDVELLVAFRVLLIELDKRI